MFRFNSKKYNFGEDDMTKTKKDVKILDDLFLVDKYGNKWGIIPMKALYLAVKYGSIQIIQYKTKKSYQFKLNK